MHKRNNNTPARTRETRAFSCLICGGETYADHLRNQRDLWCDIPVTVDYARCLECGLVQQHPAPHDAAPFYENFPVHAETSELYGRIRAAVNKGVYYRAPERADSSAVYGCDFGCGDGNFLSVINKQAGVECCGFEFSPAHAQKVAQQRGVAVYSDRDALSGKAADCGGFHFITLHNVFEHLCNPAETLQFLAGLLREGGGVYIASPLLSSFEARVFGRKWSGIEAPRHIFFPEKSHYPRLAQQCGLRLQWQRRARFAPSLAGSFSIALTGRLRAGVFNLMMPLSWALSFVLPGIILAVWLENPGRGKEAAQC